MSFNLENNHFDRLILSVMNYLLPKIIETLSNLAEHMKTTNYNFYYNCLHTNQHMLQSILRKKTF